MGVYYIALLLYQAFFVRSASFFFSPRDDTPFLAFAFLWIWFLSRRYYRLAFFWVCLSVFLSFCLFVLHFCSSENVFRRAQKHNVTLLLGIMGRPIARRPQLNIQQHYNPKLDN